MPEAPDLEVIKDFLGQRIVGDTVEKAQVLKAIVLRSLVKGDFAEDAQGRTFQEVSRRGKFLAFGMSGDRMLVVNPMLTGAVQYCPASERKMVSTHLALSLSNGFDLRYFDPRRMGMVYYLETAQVDQVPRFTDRGPDVLDEKLSFRDFCASLKRFHGEIKGILNRGSFVAGIGNAYSDEILFAAGVFPFKRRRALSEEDLRKLYEATYSVPQEAVALLRERVGDDIHKKVRNFLRVHGKGGQPCPQCGGAITRITANQRVTDYCRRCQPGMLIRN